MFHKRSDEDVLLLVIEGHVYSWDGKKAELVGGSGFARTIGEYNGVLYEGNLGRVIELPVKGRQYRHIGERRGDMPWATRFAVHGGYLYDASSDMGTGYIYKTLENTEIARRERGVKALASHDGKLYDGGPSGVYETFADRQVSDRPCDALCSNNDVLYQANWMAIYEAFSDNKIATRPEQVYALCSHNGQLYDIAGEWGIFDTLERRSTLDGPLVDLDQFSRVRQGRPRSAAIDMISVKKSTLKR